MSMVQVILVGGLLVFAGILDVVQKMNEGWGK
jgi:hypothetical protein